MAKSGPSVPERQREPVQLLVRAAARKNPYLPPHRRRSQVPHQFASPLHQFSAKSCRSWHIARRKLRRRGSCRARFLPARRGENRLVLCVGSCGAGFLKPAILRVGNTRRTHHLKHRPQKKPIQQHRSRCRKYRRQYKTRKVCNGDHRVPPVVRQTRWHAHHQIQLIDLIGFIGVQSRGSRGIWSTLCFLRRTLPPTSRVARNYFWPPARPAISRSFSGTTQFSCLARLSTFHHTHRRRHPICLGMPQALCYVSYLP
jgi:hypothetical protein